MNIRNIRAWPLFTISKNKMMMMRLVGGLLLLALASFEAAAAPPTLVTHYRLDDDWDTTGTAQNSVSGGQPATIVSPYATRVLTPAVSPNKPNTCFGASLTPSNGPISSTGNELDLSPGGKNSVSFWMYWEGGNSQMPFGFNRYDLWLQGGSFGFNTSNSDIYGISSAGLANGWHHVAAVFTNGDVTQNKLWIDGVLQTLTQRQSTPLNNLAVADSTFQWSGWTNDSYNRFVGQLDELKVYRGELTDALVQQDYAASCVVDGAVAEYRMDEAAWNGTANEVADSSGSGNHAQAFNSASTDIASPALTGDLGTCRYGVFDNGTTITQGYVQTPLGDLTSDFTVTAWIRTVNSRLRGQRILIDDQNNTGGYGISLGDGGTGKVRFYSRGITPVVLDSTYTIANNTWYFVAAVADIINKKRTIYVFDTAGALLNSTTEPPWTGGAWGTDAGPVSIGAETNASGEARANFHFRGNIDEVRVYQKVLDQNALAAIAAQRHVCPVSAPDHIRLEHDGSAISCSAETVTVKACADANCSTLFTGAVSGNVIAGGNSVPFSITAGGGQTQVNIYLPSDSALPDPQTVRLGTSAVSPVPADAAGSPYCNGDVNNTTACDMSVYKAGFLFDVPNHVSDTVQNITVSAVKQADSSLACVPAFADTSKTVNFACAYSNPASGTLPVTVGGSAVSCGVSEGVSLSFDARGIASTTVQYADVGQIALTASYSGSGGSETGLVMTGNDSFIAAPASFSVTGVTAGPIKAGNDFSATVTALNASGNATQNFGNETNPEGVTLTSTLVSPVGGANPALGNGVIAGATFSNGVATLSNLNWGEVGNITLDAALTSGSYLGSGLTATGSSATVGAFIPDHFSTEVLAVSGVPMPCPTGLTCPTLYNGFVYSGQSFSVRVTALNLGGGTTSNYDGTLGFSRDVTLGAWDALGSTTTQNPGGGTPANNSITAASFTAGVATTATPTYTFAATTAPTDIYLRATDTDGATSLRTIPASSVEGGAKIVSGRIKVSNAYGSERLPLTLQAVAQYYTANGWVNSITDSVTDLIVNGSYPVGAGTSNTTLAPATGTLNNGLLAINLSAPNTAGTATVTPDITGCGVPCPYLPVTPGTATFGIYKGNNEMIYRREAY